MKRCKNETTGWENHHSNATNRIIIREWFSFQIVMSWCYWIECLCESRIVIRYSICQSHPHHSNAIIRMLPREWHHRMTSHQNREIFLIGPQLYHSQIIMLPHNQNGARDCVKLNPISWLCYAKQNPILIPYNTRIKYNIQRMKHTNPIFINTIHPINQPTKHKPKPYSIKVF